MYDVCMYLHKENHMAQNLITSDQVKGVYKLAYNCTYPRALLVYTRLLDEVSEQQNDERVDLQCLRLLVAEGLNRL